MPKVSNANAGRLLNTSCNDGAAGMRDSLSMKAAMNMVKENLNSRGLVTQGMTKRFKDIVLDKPKRLRTHRGSKFEQNPWLGRAEEGRQAGCIEYTLEASLWRVISLPTGQQSAAEWFLAKHKGGYNGFEFWHIEDVNRLKPEWRRKRAEATGAANAAPVAATFDAPIDLADDTVSGLTFELPPAPEPPDSWEDVADN